jgi:hypothetical protein
MEGEQEASQLSTEQIVSTDVRDFIFWGHLPLK